MGPLLSMARPSHPELEQAPCYPPSPAPSVSLHLLSQTSGTRCQHCLAKFRIQNDLLTCFTTNLVIFPKQDIFLCDISCPYRATPMRGPGSSRSSHRHLLNLEICQESTTNLLLVTNTTCPSFENEDLPYNQFTFFCTHVTEITKD